MSLAFWVTLLLAAMLFGLVALAPAVQTYARLHREQYVNQVRLVEMEQRVDYLKRVIHALENDPAFREELARIEFDAVRPGDERIAVERRLSLEGASPTVSKRQAARSSRLVDALLAPVVERRPVRIGLLSASAILVLIAFTWLNDSAFERDGSKGDRPFARLLRRAFSRYGSSDR